MDNHFDTLSSPEANEKQETDFVVNRRELFKLAGIAAGAAICPFLLSTIVSSSANTVDFVQSGRNVRMRGTLTGKILLSHDDGKSWEVTANFGKECPVIGLRSNSSFLQADIGHKVHGFTLYSTDGRFWSA